MTGDNLKLPESEKLERPRKKSQKYNQINETKDQVQDVKHPGGDKFMSWTAGIRIFVQCGGYGIKNNSFLLQKIWDMLRGRMAI